MNPLSVSVVVPTRNRGSLIRETLQSLVASEHPALEILVIDQSTNDETMKAVREIAAGDQRVRHIATRTVGSSAGRNLGAHSASGEVVAYTDDDCVVSAEWLSSLAAEFARTDVAAVYGRLLPYESEKRTGHEVGFKAGLRRVEYAQRVPPWYIGHGGNMAFRRADLLAAGGFDPLLGAGGLFGACEDPDIAFRLLINGKRIVYCPDALAYHKHWKDWPSQRRMERAYGIGAGAQFAKYIRCGEPFGYRLLLTWMWQLGVRRLGSGLLKWRSAKTMYLGYCQLVYPWVGISKSLGHEINRASVTYREPAAV